jgi:hypothetical protein
MKKIVMVTTAIMVVGIVAGSIFYACHKDLSMRTNSIKNHPSYGYYNADLINNFMEEPLVEELRKCINSFQIELHNGILSFKNGEDVIALYDTLIYFSERWDKLLESNPADYEHYINSEGFPNDPILVAFEAITGFYSLRAKIENELLELESGDGITETNNPDMHFIVSNYNRALLTPDCELIIKNTIFLYGSNQNLMIFDLNFDKLEQVKSLWRAHGQVQGTLIAFEQSLATSIKKPQKSMCNCDDISFVAILDASQNCPHSFTFKAYDGINEISKIILGSDECDVISIEWDFGDGTAKSTEYTPRHKYTQLGTYSVYQQQQ